VDAYTFPLVDIALSWLIRNVLNAGNLEMSCLVDKVASLGFSWKFNLHPLLVNYVA
jgi:hypothetical protein